ncbi:MAG: hypothetical protein IJT06_01955, partial [Selenomonadaceae bacterium]|nr:hypothetical protein [Selenomonadaceae bacterium]
MSNDAKKIVDLKQAVSSTDSLSINKNENVSTSSTVTYAAGKSPNDVIKKFMKYLDTTTSYGTTALDGAVQACSNFTGIQDAINHMISDCQTANSYTEFLTEKCGIVPDNEDTGAITGFDAGGSTVKDQYSIVPESGSKINYTGSSFTVDGLTVNLGLYDSSYQFTPTTYNNLTSAQKSIWQSAYTWWVKGALDLNAESYGKNFGFSNYSSATTNTLNFGFQYGGSGTLAWTSFNIDAYGKNQALGMAVNMNYYDAIDQSDPNGSSSTAGATYLDRTLAHEFTHAVMVSNIDYYDKLPKFIREGMAELTHGIDDERGNRIINLAQNPSSLRSALDLSLTSGGDTNAYAGGYMFLRYLAKQGAVVESLGKNISNTTSSIKLTGTNNNDTVYNIASNVTVSVGAGADSIHNTGYYASIIAGEDNDTIFNNAFYSTILAGDNDDKISVGTSGDNSYIDGGAGNDSIFSADGDGMTIYGGDGNDLISISGGTSNTVSTGYGNDTITGRFGSSSINGGSGNDLISISGGAGNTVNAGYGNDTVISSITNGVKYFYTGGNDLIRGWANADT